MPASERAISAGEVCTGDRIRLTQDIWDDGEDHHQPGWLAMAGEVVIVKVVLRGAAGAALAVAHEGAAGTFLIRNGEYEASRPADRP